MRTATFIYKKENKHARISNLYERIPEFKSRQKKMKNQGKKIKQATKRKMGSEEYQLYLHVLE